MEHTNKTVDGILTDAIKISNRKTELTGVLVDEPCWLLSVICTNTSFTTQRAFILVDGFRQVVPYKFIDYVPRRKAQSTIFEIPVLFNTAILVWIASYSEVLCSFIPVRDNRL
jgi:hypothetical protein